MGIPSMSLPELRPVQTENPMDQYAKALQIRQMQQQGQMAGVDLQQKQQALKDQQAMTEAMHSWDGKDYDALLPLVIKNGASANAVIGLKQHLLEQQEKKSIIAKNDAETGGKNVETIQKKNDMVNGAIGGLLDLPDDQLQAGTAAKAQELAQNGLLDQQHLQAVQNITQLPPAQMRDQLKILQKSNMLESQQWEKAKADAQAFKDTQQGLEAKSKVDSGATIPVDQRELNAWLNTPQANGKTRQQNGLTAADYQQAQLTHTSTQSDSLGVTSTTTSAPSLNRGAAAPVNASAPTGAPRAAGPASSLPAPSLLPPGSGKMTPQQVRDNIVDMVGQYRYNPTQLARLQVKHPEIIAAINQKYPDFDQTEYNAKNKAMQSFLAGKQADQIRATNIALSHAGVLSDAIDGLQNNDTRVLNSIAQRFGLETGDNPASTFRLIVHKLAPELAQAYIAGGGGEGERGQIQTDYDPALGSKILHNNLAATVNLLRPNIDALANQYKQAIGRDDFQQRFIGKEAQGALAKFAGNPNGQPKQQHGAPQGATHAVKDASGKIIGYTSDGKTMTPAQ